MPPGGNETSSHPRSNPPAGSVPAAQMQMGILDGTVQFRADEATPDSRGPAGSGETVSCGSLCGRRPYRAGRLRPCARYEARPVMKASMRPLR